MGTNYYVKAKAPCSCCGRGYEDLHIGKASGGWQFLFAPYPELGLTSWKAWRKFLANEAEIKNEYDQDISFSEFVFQVEQKQVVDKLNADTADASQWGPSTTPRALIETADSEGYRFSTTNDFS